MSTNETNNRDLALAYIGPRGLRARRLARPDAVHAEPGDQYTRAGNCCVKPGFRNRSGSGLSGACLALCHDRCDHSHITHSHSPTANRHSHPSEPDALCPAD